MGDQLEISGRSAGDGARSCEIVRAGVRCAGARYLSKYLFTYVPLIGTAEGLFGVSEVLFPRFPPANFLPCSPRQEESALAAGGLGAQSPAS